MNDIHAQADETQSARKIDKLIAEVNIISVTAFISVIPLPLWDALPFHFDLSVRKNLAMFHL